MPVSIESIVNPILERQPALLQLRRLLELREGRLDAAPKLALYVGSTQQVAQRIKLAYDAYESRPPFNSARDAIEASGYRAVHVSAVGCAIIDGLGLERTWPTEPWFWAWTYSHAGMAMLLADSARMHRDVIVAATLFRNVGHLLIKQQLPEESDRIARSIAAGSTSGDAERGVLGFTHLDIVRALAIHWELDEELLPAFDEFPEHGSSGQLFWEAKRTLHRLGLNDPSEPMEVDGLTVHAELEQFIAAVGGVRGFVSLSNPFLASAFVSAEARAEFAMDELLAA